MLQGGIDAVAGEYGMVQSLEVFRLCPREKVSVYLVDSADAADVVDMALPAQGNRAVHRKRLGVVKRLFAVFFVRVEPALLYCSKLRLAHYPEALRAVLGVPGLMRVVAFVAAIAGKARGRVLGKAVHGYGIYGRPCPVLVLRCPRIVV